MLVARPSILNVFVSLNLHRVRNIIYIYIIIINRNASSVDNALIRPLRFTFSILSARACVCVYVHDHAKHWII